MQLGTNRDLIGRSSRVRSIGTARGVTEAAIRIGLRSIEAQEVRVIFSSPRAEAERSAGTGLIRQG
jgi:hypothetical protein